MRSLTSRRAARMAGTLLLCLALASCAAVRSRRAAPEPSGFLGDYSKLRDDPNREAHLTWVDESVTWSRYRAVHLDTVTLWAKSEDTNLSAEEQQMLTDVTYAQLAGSLGGQFELVKQPRPDAIRIRAALTQAKGANVPMRSITSILPPAFLLSTAVGLSADLASTVGTATVEVEVTDAVTDRRLAAAVDSRAGTKHIFAGKRTFQKWGDVEAATRFWADRVTGFLVDEGVQRKPGAPDL